MRVRALSFNDDPESKAVLYACGECGKCYSPKDVGVQNAIDIAKQCCTSASGAGLRTSADYSVFDRAQFQAPSNDG